MKRDKQNSERNPRLNMKVKKMQNKWRIEKHYEKV